MEDDLFLNSVQYQQKVERLRVGRFSELNSEWPPAAVRGSCLYQHLRPYSCNFPFSVRMYLLCLFLAVQHHQRRHARTFSMASVAFDSRWQCWLLLIYLFMYLYLFVFCCGCQAARAVGEKWTAELRQAIIEFAWSILHSTPRGPTITVDRHCMLAARQMCSPSIRPALTQWRQEDLFYCYW